MVAHNYLIYADPTTAQSPWCQPFFRLRDHVPRTWNLALDPIPDRNATSDLNMIRLGQL
jgi:hypothetical protein